MYSLTALHRTTLTGLFVDTLNYSLVLSVFPFRLEYLGYNNVSALNGWLLFIYVRSMVPFCDSPLRDYGVSLHIHHPLQSGALVLGNFVPFKAHVSIT
jgi:hypothetical protein